MAKGFKHGGGGGSELNFRVIGAAEQPVSPRENDIWVECDGMTGWVFSVKQPEEAAEGLVCLSIDTESSVAFNALKKNKLTVYPVSASQYVGGAWVSRTAQSWQGGKWVSWWLPGTLFADGIDATDLTGGWASKAYIAGTGYTGVTVAVSVSSDGVSAALNAGINRSTFVGTNNMVDVSGYSTLRMAFSEATRSTASGAIKACLYSDAGYTIAAEAAVVPVTGDMNLEPEIDVSQLDGKYYIGFMMWSWNTCALTAKMTTAKLV